MTDADTSAAVARELRAWLKRHPEQPSVAREAAEAVRYALENYSRNPQPILHRLVAESAATFARTVQ